MGGPVRLRVEHAPVEARLAAAAEAGEHLGAIQGGDHAPLDTAGIERLVALEAAVGRDQHLLQGFQGESRQAVAQRVVVEGAWSLNPVAEMRLGQIRL